jgi:hypothetical protein
VLEFGLILASNILPGSEIVGHNYGPYLFLTIERWFLSSQKNPQVQESPVCLSQVAPGALLEANGRVNLPMQSLSQFGDACLLVEESFLNNPSII